jgi:hypothetical protein
VSYQPIGGQSRICVAERCHDFGEGFVLGGLVGNCIDSFEFNADREVIAGRATVMTGLARMPCTLCKLYELCKAAVARHDQMCGHPQSGYFRKIRVYIGRQRVREQPIYPGPAKFAGRQAYSVHDDEFRFNAAWTRIAIWRRHLPRAPHQSAVEINLQVNALIADSLASICDNRGHMNVALQRRHT